MNYIGYLALYCSWEFCQFEVFSLIGQWRLPRATSKKNCLRYKRQSTRPAFLQLMESSQGLMPTGEYHILTSQLRDMTSSRRAPGLNYLPLYYSFLNVTFPGNFFLFSLVCALFTMSHPQTATPTRPSTSTCGPGLVAGVHLAQDFSVRLQA